MIAGNRLTTQANDFVGAINFARSEAITPQHQRHVLPRGPRSTTQLLRARRADWTNWIVRKPPGTVVRRGVVNIYGGGIARHLDLANDR